MKILVTGPNGLVGARLLPRLIEYGFECRALVRSGNTVAAGATAVQGELLDAPSLQNAVEGVSAVVHLAAVFRTADDDLIWKSNLDGTRNLIDATLRHSPSARFILASTSNIYDATGSRPGRENDDAHPQLAYPASKLAAENVLRSTSLCWSILRFGFVYGEQDGHLEALPSQVQKSNWHPAKKMSVVHHRDVANSIQLALAGAMDSRIVNIVDDAPTSLFELAQLIGQRIEPSSGPLENPWHLHVDGSLARTLGYRPQVSSVYQAAEEELL